VSWNYKARAQWKAQALLLLRQCASAQQIAQPEQHMPKLHAIYAQSMQPTHPGRLSGSHSGAAEPGSQLPARAWEGWERASEMSIEGFGGGGSGLLSQPAQILRLIGVSLPHYSFLRPLRVHLTSCRPKSLGCNPINAELHFPPTAWPSLWSLTFTATLRARLMRATPRVLEAPRTAEAFRDLLASILCVFGGFAATQNGCREAK